MNGKTIITAALAGALFALGLLISGMTIPAKVIGFLDVGGAWDPSLAFVMAGAIAVYAPIAHLARRRERPVLDTCFYVPGHRAIDLRLVSGAAVFGIGWGLSGYCPGPAIVSVGTGASELFAFVVAMLVGMASVRAVGVGDR